MKSSFFDGLVEGLARKIKCRVAIPIAEDEACAHAVSECVTGNLISAILIGDPEKIRSMYSQVADSSDVQIIDEKNEQAACKLAVRMVKSQQADILMKGLVSTSVLLKAVLNSQDGIKQNPLLSHLTFFEFQSNPGVKILTDAALNVAPDQKTLELEINNAAEAFGLFCSQKPKIALLAANEKVSEKLPSTVAAREVAESMKSRQDIIVGGPISLDLAISTESVEIKGYDGPVKGDADIFVVPRIETGNVFYKSLQYFTSVAMGGLVYGASCPVVLTSRSDDNDTKFHSLVLGTAMWQRARSSQEA